MYNSIKDLQNTVGLFFTFDVDLVGQKEGYEIWYVYDENGNISFLDAAANGDILTFTEYDAEYMEFYFDAVNNPGKVYGSGRYTILISTSRSLRIPEPCSKAIR